MESMSLPLLLLLFTLSPFLTTTITTTSATKWTYNFAITSSAAIATNADSSTIFPLPTQRNSTSTSSAVFDSLLWFDRVDGVICYTILALVLLYSLWCYTQDRFPSLHCRLPWNNNNGGSMLSYGSIHNACVEDRRPLLAAHSLPSTIMETPADLSSIALASSTQPCFPSSAICTHTLRVSIYVTSYGSMSDSPYRAGFYCVLASIASCSSRILHSLET